VLQWLNELREILNELREIKCASMPLPSQPVSLRKGSHLTV
jgi:hypothetical protein